MDRHIRVGLSAVAIWGLALLPSDATGQQKSASEQLLGTWSLVSFEFVRPDGSKQSTYGADPKGIAFFDAGGHYIISVMHSGRAHFATNSPVQGTEAENKATAQEKLPLDPKEREALFREKTYSCASGDSNML